MKKLAVILLCIIGIKANAQDLIIHYDFITDKFWYEKKGKPVAKPLVKKNYEVKVMVENLNPFVFVARCTWTEETVDDNSSISGIASMFTGFSTGTEMLTGLLSGVNPDVLDLTEERGVSMFGEFATAKIDLQSAFRSYNTLFDVEQTMLKSDYTAARLKKLRFNPYMPADTLKKVAATMVLNALYAENSSINQISATTFLNRANAMSNDLVEEYNNLLASADNFLNAYNAYSSAHGSNFGEAGLDRTVRNMLTNARQLTERYSAEDIHTRLEALESQYNAITYTPFVYVCNHVANGDKISVNLDFYETSPYTRTSDYYMGGGDNVDTLRKIRTKTINMMVQGDMKITTSVGLGFPTYFKDNVEFSNRDSLITSTVGNNYSPCIATFLNFYPYSGKNVHWGGTFGVGIPVQSGGTSNLNFFLGGSAVLGNTSKVAIHGGLAIGQLPALSDGKKVGDNMGDDFTIPETKKEFKTGAFFGISFALGK